MSKAPMSQYAFRKEHQRASEQHEKARDEWAFYIGHTILKFSEIEHLTLLFIERMMPALEEFSTNLLIDKRLDLLLHVLPEYEHIEDTYREQLLTTLERVRKLFSKRNLIAHNPVLLTFSAESESGKLVGEGKISSARKKNVDLNLTQMIKFTDEAEACRAELNSLFSKTAVRMRMGGTAKPKRKRSAPKRSTI